MSLVKVSGARPQGARRQMACLKDKCMVIEVEGMSINANLDARNTDLGYNIFLRKNKKMDQFYE